MGQKICIIKRMDGWEKRLTQFLKAREEMPFRWGVHDCMLFAGDAIEAITHVDFTARYRGKYKTAFGAQMLVKKLHGGIISNIFYEHLGEPIGHPLKARRGDVGIYEVNGITSGGVVDDTGKSVAFITPMDGLVRVPLNDRMLIWEVG